VLMGPYDDGRYTACISSQAGCAQGCVFCATGQMGFRRQLSSDEILEQVARFAAELQKNEKAITATSTNKQPPRLSNIVFMGMGEPLSNYVNVRTAIHRIINELGIGARRITVSTVGIVPRIRQMWQARRCSLGGFPALRFR
jgi:23S rRNA (adenine2503-C2)-methyltransferase